MSVMNHYDDGAAMASAVSVKASLKQGELPMFPQIASVRSDSVDFNNQESSRQ